MINDLCIIYFESVHLSCSIFLKPFLNPTHPNAVKSSFQFLSIFSQRDKIANPTHPKNTTKWMDALIDVEFANFEAIVEKSF